MRARDLMQVSYLGYSQFTTLGEAEAELTGIRTAIAHLREREARVEMAMLEFKFGKFDESQIEKQYREQQEKQQKELEEFMQLKKKEDQKVEETKEPVEEKKE